MIRTSSTRPPSGPTSETRRDLDGIQRTRLPGKPRPAVILQDDRFDTDSVTLCPITIDPTDAPLFRLVIEATPTTGLSATSRLMVDKITTVRRTKLGERIGELGDADIVRLNRAVVTFLGIASASQAN